MKMYRTCKGLNSNPTASISIGILMEILRLRHFGNESSGKVRVLGTLAGDPTGVCVGHFFGGFGASFSASQEDWDPLLACAISGSLPSRLLRPPCTSLVMHDA